MGIQSSKSGPVMGLERLPSQVQVLPPTVNPRTGDICGFSSGSRSHRRGEIHYIPRKTFHTSKERNSGTQSNFRPFKIKQVHCLPTLQNDNSRSGETNNFQRGLDGQFRHQGCIPSCPHCSGVQEVPGVPNRPKIIPVQSSSLRPKYSTPSILKANNVRPQTAQTQRNTAGGLYR